MLAVTCAQLRLQLMIAMLAFTCAASFTTHARYICGALCIRTMCDCMSSTDYIHIILQCVWLNRILILLYKASVTFQQ